METQNIDFNLFIPYPDCSNGNVYNPSIWDPHSPNYAYIRTKVQDPKFGLAWLRIHMGYWLEFLHPRKINVEWIFSSMGRLGMIKAKEYRDIDWMWENSVYSLQVFMKELLN